MPASVMARRARATNSVRWCRAVSLGRKPVPGGEMNVCRRLERMVAEVGVWRMRPMPSLLAEPSQPRAIQEDLVEDVGGADVDVDVDVGDVMDVIVVG